MILDELADNLELGLWTIEQLQAMEFAGAPLAIDAAFRTLTGVPVNSVFVPGTSGYPWWYYGQSGEYTLFLGRHTSTLAQAAAIWRGYWPPLIGSLVEAKNILVDQATDSILAAINLQHFAVPTKFVAAGHSIGGAIAQMLAYKMKLFNVDINAKMITFGSPKPAGSQLNDVLIPAYSQRWINVDDAVPNIPPRGNDAAILPFAGGIGLNIPWLLRFVHLPGGRWIDADGNTGPTDQPAVANTPSLVNFAGWLLDQATATSGPHSLQEYQRRLSLLLPPLGGGGDLPDEGSTGGGGDWPGGGPEVAMAMPPVQIRQLVNAQVQTVFATGQQQNAEPVNVPTPNRARAVRVGRVWHVEFNGQTIAVGPTKRRARALANAFNRTLDHMQVQAVVDPAAIVNTMESYLEDAADPNGTFQPVMNVVYPAT
jgi:hypothetical protein